MYRRLLDHHWYPKFSIHEPLGYTSDLGRENIGESWTGVIDVGLWRIEEVAVLVEAPARSSSFSSSSPPVLTLSNSDLLMYFLPFRSKNSK